MPLGRGRPGVYAAKYNPTISNDKLNLLRTVIINESLEKTLTRERLEKYLQETNQDLDAALKLYEQNTRISESFYTPLQCVEICLRNSIHYQLSNAYGEEWFRNSAPPLVQDSLHMIFDAT